MEHVYILVEYLNQEPEDGVLYGRSCKGRVSEPQSINQHFTLSVHSKVILDPHRNLIKHVYIMVEYLNQE